MAILAAARWLTFIVFLVGTNRVEPGIWRAPQFDREQLGRLLDLGSWITITNLVSPLLVYCDRFIIGTLVSASLVAYYTTPQDAISRVLALPIAMAATLYPAIGCWRSRSPWQQRCTQRSPCAMPSNHSRAS